LAPLFTANENWRGKADLCRPSNGSSQRENGRIVLNKRTWNFGENAILRRTFVVLFSLLAWVDGIVLFVYTRPIGPFLPFPVTRYFLIASHFVPWILSLFAIVRIGKSARRNDATPYNVDLSYLVVVVLTTTTYLVLFILEWPLAAAFRAAYGMR